MQHFKLHDDVYYSGAFYHRGLTKIEICFLQACNCVRVCKIKKQNKLCSF